MDELFEISDKLKKIGIQLVLIQIHEAHSTLWPISLEGEVEPHKCFEDRVKRANEFVEKYNVPYEVYIDGWDNEFDNLFQSWPDREYFVTKDKTILKTCSYDHEIETDENEATSVEEYLYYLKELIKNEM